jgi:hypothetical protein
MTTRRSSVILLDMAQAIAIDVNKNAKKMGLSVDTDALCKIQSNGQ